jgi:hypothetical protein
LNHFFLQTLPFLFEHVVHQQPEFFVALLALVHGLLALESRRFDAAHPRVPGRLLFYRSLLFLHDRTQVCLVAVGIEVLLLKKAIYPHLRLLPSSTREKKAPLSIIPVDFSILPRLRLLALIVILPEFLIYNF